MAIQPIQEYNNNPAPQISPYLMDIAQKKVHNQALTCFEAFVHSFLLFFSCCYSAYRHVYTDLAKNLGTENQMNVPANIPIPSSQPAPSPAPNPALGSRPSGSGEINPLPVKPTPDQDRALMTVFNNLLENSDEIPSNLKPDSDRGNLAQNAHAMRQWIHKNPQIPGASARVLDKLTDLSLDEFNLPSLPPEINLLPNLRRLTICSSKITSLPDHFNPPKLKTLTIVNTPITKLPEGFNPLHLEWTEELKLLRTTSGASVTTVEEAPAAVLAQPDTDQAIKDRALVKFFSMITPQMQSIEENYPGTLVPLSGDLAADGQAIRAWFAKNPYDPFGVPILETITELTLKTDSHNVATPLPLPSEINQLKNLVELLIEFEAFNELPDDFDLPNLVILKLGGQFTHLPQSLNTHKKLRWLITYRSRITALSDEFNPENLQRLSLDSSLIKHLPPALSTHKNLERLYIEGCLMTQFADDFNPENLEELHFEDTPITKLPDACELRNLKTFNCNYHWLERLPLRFEPRISFNWDNLTLQTLRQQQLAERKRAGVEVESSY